MANEPIITVIGNLTEDLTLRFTANGHAVANFSIAQTPREKDASGQFVDGETLFFRGSIWREAAENAAESLTKGMRVVAYGKLKARSYETRDGQQRTVWELDAEELAPSLRFATAVVNRAPKDNPGFGATAPGNDGWGAGGGGWQ